MNLLIRCLKALNNTRIIFLGLILFVSCRESQLPFNTSKETEPAEPKQGVKGKVIYKEGTFDARGNLLSNGTVIGVARKIYFYELTGLKEVELDGGTFVSNIHTDVIDSVKSDKNGNFAGTLQPGIYSIFINENDRLYSNINDDGLFMPIKVYKDSVTEMNVYIDYNANYTE
ncbi:hypothetical protein [Cytophaga aurantiaca]|uniref:hypothetical protein n=1 Tax=Cytophaga aurantiaca TaxID=29530 RepID=UPI000378EFAA|nr:hypothetical protein [Cytophaga aurantiaca]